MSEPDYLFVTYAHADAALVTSDVDALRSRGINLWYDEAIPGGVLWREELAHRIRGSRGVVCFLSPRSSRSEYCVQEIGFAIDEGKPLICVYIEPVELTAGLRMSLAHRQALIRYATSEAAYREKLVHAARVLGAASEPADDIPETQLLPDVLIITYGDLKAIVPGDFAGRYSIGRGADCQLKIESNFISRHHGFVNVRQGEFQYRDQSRNGSLLKTANGEQLIQDAEVALPPSGELKIGDVTIRFQVLRSNGPLDRSV